MHVEAVESVVVSRRAPAITWGRWNHTGDGSGTERQSGGGEELNGMHCGLGRSRLLASPGRRTSLLLFFKQGGAILRVGGATLKIYANRPKLQAVGNDDDVEAEEGSRLGNVEDKKLY